MRTDGALRDRVQLLKADPDLGAGLEPEALRTALKALVVPLVSLRRGQWDPPTLGDGAVGFVLLDGFLVRQVGLGPASSCELLGPGDVLRPWENAFSDHLLPPHTRWRVIEPAHMAIIDRRACVLIAYWPGINETLLERVTRRAGCLAYLMTAQKFVRVEDRLLAALWHFATMWGRVRRDGVLIPCALTHELLADIAGARRPSVSIALAALADRNLVDRDRHKRVILHGDPPRWERSRRRSVMPPV